MLHIFTYLMYICVEYTYANIDIYTCVDYIHIYIYMYLHTCVFRYTYVYMYTYAFSPQGPVQGDEGLGKRILHLQSQHFLVQHTGSIFVMLGLFEYSWPLGRDLFLFKYIYIYMCVYRLGHIPSLHFSTCETNTI